MRHWKRILDALGLPAEYETIFSSGWNGEEESGEYLHTPSFITEFGRYAGLGHAELSAVSGAAERIGAFPEAKKLLAHCSQVLRDGTAGTLARWPETIPALGEADSGCFYLLAGLAIVPDFFLTCRKLGIPDRYAEAAASRIGTLSALRMGKRNSTGLLPRSLEFLRNFKNGTHFRIERFEFQEMSCPDNFPRLFQELGSGKILLLCAPGWPVSPAGYLLRRGRPESEGAFSTLYTETPEMWRGNAIAEDGRVPSKELVSLAKRDWKEILSPGDPVAGIHIPGGGGMTPESVDASLAQAEAFFSRYRKSIRAFTCVSWILNPELAQRLPDSNIAAFQRRGFPFPVRASPEGRDGLFFVFGREDDDYGTYPRDNTLRKTLLAILESGKSLCSGGIVMPLCGKKAYAVFNNTYVPKK